MSYVFGIKQGENLPLQLQLDDGDFSLPKRVFVRLSYPNGTLVEPLFEISHITGGDFRDDTRVMPSNDYLVAQYYVYENDGVTLDEDYIITKDIFVQSITTVTIENNQEISGEFGFDSIIGEFDSDKIAGTIYTENEITGVVIDEL